MSLEHKIPFETEEGNTYVLLFSFFNKENLPIQTPIIDVTLVAIEQISPVNSVRTFNYITNAIFEYLKNKEVILYYYCDQTPMFFRDSRNITSFQEFRFKLFNALFEKANKPSLRIHNVIIDDEINGNHYVSLIYKEVSQIEIETLSSELSKLGK